MTKITQCTKQDHVVIVYPFLSKSHLEFELEQWDILSKMFPLPTNLHQQGIISLTLTTSILFPVPGIKENIVLEATLGQHPRCGVKPLLVAVW